MFSGKLGNIRGAEYEIELLDQVPVQSPPYQYAQPKLKLLKEFVDDLLRKGIVRPSKFPYASPSFLLPKSGGGSSKGSAMGRHFSVWGHGCRVYG